MTKILNNSQDFFLESYFKSNQLATSYRVEVVDADVSVRRFYRITQGDNSYILMQADPNSLTSFIAISEYFIEFKIRVPKVIASDHEAGLILCQDVGKKLLQDVALKSLAKALPYYKKSLTELVKIQTAATDSNHPCLAKQIKFTQEKFLDELKMTEEFLFQKIMKSNYDSNKLNAELNRLSEICSQMPYCLTHRDFHSRNILVDNNEISIVDFQDARMGPYEYDVLSLLKDAYIELDDKTHDHLLEFYFELRKNSDNFSIVDFKKNYPLVTLQRSLKAMGTFARVYVERKNSDYLRFLQISKIHCLKAIKEIQGDFSEINKIIEGLKL